MITIPNALNIGIILFEFPVTVRIRQGEIACGKHIMLCLEVEPAGIFIVEHTLDTFRIRRTLIAVFVSDGPVAASRQDTGQTVDRAVVLQGTVIRQLIGIDLGIFLLQSLNDLIAVRPFQCFQ